MIRKLIILTTLLTSALPAGAVLADDLALPGDRRIKLLAYDETDVYTIQTKYGFQTSIVFDNTEEIQTISVGDRTGWQIIPSGSRLFIRPLIENITTNMTILTSKRAYQFDLKSASSSVKNAKGGRPEDVVYVAKFTYPPKEKARDTSYTPSPIIETTPNYSAVPLSANPAIVPTAPAVKAPVHSGVTSPSNPNYSYTYSGPDDLAPLQVYDDGSSTYIKYRTVDQPIPNAFVLAEGSETPVNTRIHDGFMVIDAVAGELVLKNSNGTVHVYNEVLNPR